MNKKFVIMTVICLLVGCNVVNADTQISSNENQGNYVYESLASDIVVVGDYTFDKAVGRIDKYSGMEENVVIPSEIGGVDVNWIGAMAFADNKTIKTVTIPETVEKIWEDGLGYYGSYTFLGATNLEAIYVDKDNQYFKSIDGVLMAKTGIGTSSRTTLLWYPGNKSDIAYYVPKCVDEINNLAFQDCSNLKEIYFIYDDVKVGAFTFKYGTDLIFYCVKGTSIDQYTSGDIFITVYIEPTNKCDIDGDGYVVAGDAALVMQYILNNERVNFNLEQISKADVNGDCIIDASDAALIMQYILNSASI